MKELDTSCEYGIYKFFCELSPEPKKTIATIVSDPYFGDVVIEFSALEPTETKKLYEQI